MTRYTINGYKRISKAEARKRYNAGELVTLCPVNLIPGAPWNPEITVTKFDSSAPARNVAVVCTMDFETLVNGFEFYNIRGAETGRYTAYYKREDITA